MSVISCEWTDHCVVCCRPLTHMHTSCIIAPGHAVRNYIRTHTWPFRVHQGTGTSSTYYTILPLWWLCSVWLGLVVLHVNVWYDLLTYVLSLFIRTQDPRSCLTKKMNYSAQLTMCPVVVGSCVQCSCTHCTHSWQHCTQVTHLQCELCRTASWNS